MVINICDDISICLTTLTWQVGKNMKPSLWAICLPRRKKATSSGFPFY